jgi:hypothetical protein
MRLRARTASLLLAACSGLAAAEPPAPAEPPAAAADTGRGRAARRGEPGWVARIVDAEELILALTPGLSRLAASVENLRFPDADAAAHFAERVAYTDLAPGARPSSPPKRSDARAPLGLWPVDPTPRAASPRDLDLWRALFATIDWFENASFAFVRGSFREGRSDLFDALVAFDGLARTRAGTYRAVSAELEVAFARTPGAPGAPPEAAWRIERFALRNLATRERGALMFRDVRDAALPDPATQARARGSLHEEHLLRWAREGEQFRAPHPWFRIKPTDAQPGLAVVDLDRDGWDDLYLLDRWGRALLLRNRGDGTFEDVAKQVGLDLEDHNSSALFADFDNDGDPDVFVGRTFERSRYFANEGGRFVDRSAALVEGWLPYLVASISAADVNGDGLLDVYLSTYGAELLEVEVRKPGRAERGALLAEFLPPAQALRMGRAFRGSHKYLDRAGPPNVLLLNRGGGRFAAAPEGPLALWRNSFQATFGDYDADGDPDLYVANDFAPNNLFRNEGGGRFVDVTEATGTADIGFGMGASFGDYDNDGRQDLYVTNMYSKAGSRITAQVPGLDPRLAKMAGGNSLFRNAGERFEKISGTEPPALEVEKAGWSWGGQFLDVDNDGFLDLYAASGFYTAPPAVAIEGADL